MRNVLRGSPTKIFGNRSFLCGYSVLKPARFHRERGALTAAFLVSVWSRPHCCYWSKRNHGYANCN